MPIPLQSRLPKTYPIAHIRRETENVQSFTFDVSFGAAPGQFVMLWLPGVDEVPMSVAMDDGKRLTITFFAVGDLTKELAAKKEGDLVGLRGPFGTRYHWEPAQHLILVAGGYGAAPMYFVANEATKDSCTIDFIVGARSAEHLLYLDAIGTLPRVTLHIATDDGSKGHKGYNTELLDQLFTERVNELTGNELTFSCGPEMMMKRVAEICAERSLPCFLSMERYMKCGFGLCGNCVVDPSGERMCVHGPVVPGTRCLEYEDFGAYHRDALGKKHAL